MTAGRRVLLLSSAFLGLAVLLTGGPARAQDRSSHKLWKDNLTPDQIRDALAKMGAGEFGDLDPFQEMIKDYLLKNNPGIDKQQADEVIKKLTGNKQLMEQLKQYAKQKQTEPGRPGKLSQDELAKLLNTKPGGGELPKLPNDIKGFGGPKGVGPNGEPKVGPVGDPKVGPVVEPKVEPPKKIDIAEPPVPPGKQPDTPKDKISLDKNPFPEPEDSSDPRTKSLDAFAALWERNIGPLDETPEVKRALFDLVGDNGLNFDIKDGSGNSLWDLLKNGGVDASGLGDMFNGAGGPGGGNWDFGKWEWPKMGSWFGGGSSSSGGNSSSSSWFGGGSSRPRPSSPSSGGGGGFGGGGGIGGIGGAWLPFLLLLLVVLAVVVWLKLKNLRDAAPVLALADGLGPWPVDPRSINTREDVVLAFEYLSVLVCGPSAKNWTHGTIAEALSDLATTHEETALMLARLYELARYAPLDEPLTRDELVEARRLVCSLAGVSY